MGEKKKSDTDARSAVRRFRQRRSARLGFDTIMHYDSVEAYRRRREERLRTRMDDDDDSTGGAKKGGHGNTKIPFGLCQQEGIEIQKEWTPSDAWAALEGKGYSASETYGELKKTGKATPKKSGSQSKGPAAKDYSSMDFDALTKEYEDHNRRYKETEEKFKNKNKTIRSINSTADRVKKMKESGAYHGETYEELKANEPSDEEWNSFDSDEFVKHYDQHMAMKAMDTFGRDIFEKSNEEIDKIASEKVEEVSSIGFGELNAERKEIQGAMAKQAKEKYKNFSDCDSYAALESRIRGDDYFAVSEYASTAMDFHGMEPETVKGVGRALDTIQSKFPELSKMLRPPTMDDSVDGNAYAHCAVSSFSGAEVTLSRRWFSNSKEMMSMLESDVKSHFHPPGTANVESLVTHEYAHAIDDLMSKKYRKELGGKSFGVYVLDRVCENHPREGRSSLMGKISRYAVNNKSPEAMEFLAEAFSEVCSSKKPRPLAIEVGEIMKEFISNPQSALAPRKPKWQWAPPDDDEEIPLF